MRARLVSVTVVVLLAVVAAAAAQQGGSSIRGRVVDQQRAVLAGVPVLVTHQESGLFRETVTTEDGTYFVSGLTPGPYRVSAELQGFRKITRENVILEIGSTLTLELMLEVGAVAETLTVSAQAPQVDLTSAQGGGHVTSGELKDLPSSSRNFVGYVALLPGVQYNPSSSPSADSVNVNGQHASQVNYVVDGANNNDDMRGGSSGTQVRPSLESVQEFQVVTNQFEAEYGRSTGGIVNAITKQGTNAFRGSGFGYLTDVSLTAKDFFVAQQNAEKPNTAKQQWGGTLGGPILQNRAHFFTSLERIHLGQGVSRVYPLRPDRSFSEITDWNFWNVLVRADHQLSANNTYGGRWLLDYQPNLGRVDGNLTMDTRQNEYDHDSTASWHFNSVLGGRRLNTLRAAFTREDVDRASEKPEYRESGQQDQQLPTLRFVSFDDQFPFFALHRWQTSYQIDDSFSWFIPGKRGDHDLKFGVQYVYAEHRQLEQSSMNGVFSFPGDRAFNAADPSTYPERLSIRVPTPERPHVFTHSIGLFAQNKWQLVRNFTVTAGLRYDVDIAPIVERWNPLFDDAEKYPVDRNNIQPRIGFAYSTGGNAVIRGGFGLFYEKLWTDRFEPFVRQGVFADSFMANFPVDRADPGPSSGRLPTDPMLVSGPIVNRDRLNELFSPGVLARNTGTVFLDTPDRKIPSARQTSIGYQRQLGAQLSFAADYVHTSGRNQVIAYDLNPAIRVDTSRTGAITRVDFLGLASQLGIAPFASRVLTRETVGQSEFDGLNLQFEKRFVNWWGARVAYSLGHARGDTSGTPTADNNFQVLQERNLDLNQGLADADRRHVLSLSGRTEIPGTSGLTVSAIFRAMSGRPLTIHDTAVDGDRNGLLFDPLPPGTYSGVGQNAITVENKGGRNGARGPGFAQLDFRLGYRLTMGRSDRTLDLFAEIFNATNEPNFSNPSGDRRLPTFLIPSSLLADGFPRQLQFGTRLGF